jgi:hypothetical protein
LFLGLSRKLHCRLPQQDSFRGPFLLSFLFSIIKFCPVISTSPCHYIAPFKYDIQHDCPHLPSGCSTCSKRLGNTLSFRLVYLRVRRWHQKCLVKTRYRGFARSVLVMSINFLQNAENPNTLSDITGAAGWEILDCDETSTDPQDIRLVCVDESKGCRQLFGDGAENTIIRLPETCAGM